jgi:hypothetical protein
MKSRQKENAKRRLMLSKKVILKLNYVELREIVGGNKTSTIPTCVSNEVSCFIKITQ